MTFCNLLKTAAALLTSACVVAACSSSDGDGNSGGGGSNSAGANATAGSAGTAQAGGGATSAGTNAGGSSNTGGSAGGSSNTGGGGVSSAGSTTGGSGPAPMCMGPKRDFSKSPHACTGNHSFPTFPWDYSLATPTAAGQPYAIEIDVVGTGSPTVVIWGGTAECQDKADPLFEQVLPAGQHCLVLEPTAAYTHLVVGATGDTSDNTEQLRGVCGNGSCP